MKHIFTYSILSCFIFLSISSCYRDKDTDGQFSDEFYLRHEGADLPIWVRGNSDAETFILFIHGGPFDTAIENAVWGHFEELHEDYAIVYFDQRGGGYAHGQQSVNLNEAQFVEDVEVVLQLIQEKYPQAKSMFLMGHSYGGYLGTAVLKAGDNQTNFKGWIELAGAHNFPLGWLLSREFSMNYAQQQIDANKDEELWSEKLEDLQNTPQVTNYDELLVINRIAFEVGVDMNNGNSNFENPPWLYTLSSPVGAGFSQHNNRLVADMLVNGNHNPEMPNITIPSLLIYGGRDPLQPIGIGENGIEYLGTPDQDKYLVLLEESGHSLWEYESNRFFNEIKEFITQYE